MPMSATSVLAEVMAMYKHEVTHFESVLWLELIQQYGEPPIIRALMDHAREGTSFAPKVAEIRKRLNPAHGDVGIALEVVLRHAREQGPYRSPTFSDPAIVLAIQGMGGWAAVAGEQLPDPAADPHGWRAFSDRFSAAYREAKGRLLVSPDMNLPRLSGIHQPALALAGPGERASQEFHGGDRG